MNMKLNSTPINEDIKVKIIRKKRLSSCSILISWIVHLLCCSFIIWWWGFRGWVLLGLIGRKSSALSWATGSWCITTHKISSGTRNVLHFKVFWLLECLHLQNEIPWECSPYPNQNPCCTHTIYTHRLERIFIVSVFMPPHEAWHGISHLWHDVGEQTFGVSELGIPNQCTSWILTRFRSTGRLWCREGRFPEVTNRVKILMSSSAALDSAKLFLSPASFTANRELKQQGLLNVGASRISSCSSFFQWDAPH